MCSLLVWLLVDGRFSSQTNDYKIGICCFQGIRAKTSSLRIGIMGPSGTTCLPAYYFFSTTIKVQLEAYWTSTMDESSHRMQLLFLPMIY